MKWAQLRNDQGEASVSAQFHISIETEALFRSDCPVGHQSRFLCYSVGLAASGTFFGFSQSPKLSLCFAVKIESNFCQTLRMNWILASRGGPQVGSQTPPPSGSLSIGSKSVFYVRKALTYSSLLLPSWILLPRTQHHPLSSPFPKTKEQELFL